MSVCPESEDGYHEPVLIVSKTGSQVRCDLCDEKLNMTPEQWAEARS